jgi:phosphohistidine phosphatase
MPTRLLYLLRHATAQDRALPIADADRALVPKGRRQVNQVVAFCQQHELVPKRLLSSPVLRARQTAEGLAKHLPGCCAVQEAEWLRIETPTAQALEGLRAALAAQPDDLWLVGHEPDLSALLAALVGAPASAFVLKKASLSCLALPDDAPAQLLWSVPCGLMG